MPYLLGIVLGVSLALLVENWRHKREQAADARRYREYLRSPEKAAADARWKAFVDATGPTLL